jgi:hypothetical protein
VKGAVSSNDFERTTGIKPSDMPFDLFSQAVRREDAYHVMKDRFSGLVPPKSHTNTPVDRVQMKSSEIFSSPGKQRAPIPLHEQLVSSDARMRASSRMLLGDPTVRSDEHGGTNPIADLRRRMEQLAQEEMSNSDQEEG